MQQPSIQQSMFAFKASMVIGALWALWHLPVLIDRNIVSIIILLLLAFTSNFLFPLMFNGSAGSLLLGLVFHAFQNNEETVEALFPALIGTEWGAYFYCLIIDCWYTGRDLSMVSASLKRSAKS